jgi:hypothetical protein
MSVPSKLIRLIGVSGLGLSVLASTTASAADLSCVHRALDWIKGTNQSTIQFVNLSTVALHGNGIAAYGTGVLAINSCSIVPWGIGSGDCMRSEAPIQPLLSDRIANSGGLAQPFDVRSPMTLSITEIPTNSLGEVRMSRPGAVYTFHPECVGELLTGNDQWGNHWTMSFQLASRQNIR